MRRGYTSDLSSPWATAAIFAAITFLGTIHWIKDGSVLIASTDNLWFWLPMLDLFHDSFWNGEFGYWNPFTVAGTGNYLNTNYTPFSVEFLFLALLPKSWMLHGLTFLFLTHLFFIGVLSHRILLRESGDLRWSITGAAIAQLSLPTIVALTSPAALFNITYFLLAVFGLWGISKETALRSLLIVALGLTLCALTGNLAIGVWGGFAFILIAACRLSLLTNPSTASRWTVISVLAFAIPAAFLLSSIHWLPVLLSVSATPRLGGGLQGYIGEEMSGYWSAVARVFAPEWLGVNYRLTNGYFGVLVKSASRHIQSTAPVSFGVMTALILFVSAFAMRGRQISVWLAATGLIIAIAGYIDPLYSLYSLLANPVLHPFGVEFFLPIFVGFLLVYAGPRFFQVLSFDNMKLGFLLVLALSLVAYYAYGWSAIGRKLDVGVFTWINPTTARWVLVGLACVFVLCLLAGSRMQIAFAAIGAMLLGVIFVAAVFYWSGIGGGYYGESTALVSGRVLLYAAVPLALLFIGHDTAVAARRNFLVVAILVSLLLLSSVIISRPSGALHFEVGIYQDAVIATMSVAAFVFASISFVLVAKLVGTTKSYAWGAQGLLCAVIVADLILTWRINDRVIIYPAHHAEQLDRSPNYVISDDSFRDQNGREVDFINYRVAKSVSLLSAVKEGVWLQFDDSLETNNTAMLGISSFNGIPHIIEGQTEEFFAQFGYKLRHGIRADFDNPRFLDLLSVAYIFNRASGTFEYRDTALARFQFFQSYRVVESPLVALQLIASPEFKPKDEAVLLAPVAGLSDGGAKISRPVSITRGTSDHIRIETTIETAGIILFNDTYSPWWKVNVNGAPVPLLRANHSRMAFPVPAGPVSITLDFVPPFLTWAAILTGIGAAILAAGGLWLSRGSAQARAVLTQDGNENRKATKAAYLYEKRSAGVFVGVVLLAGLVWLYPRSGTPSGLRMLEIKCSQTSSGSCTALRSQNGFWEARGEAQYTVIAKLEASKASGLGCYLLGTGSHGADSTSRMPHRWILSGSADGQEWAVLDQRSGVKNWQAGQDQYFPINNLSKISYIRLIILPSGPDELVRLYRLKVLPRCP